MLVCVCEKERGGGEREKGDERWVKGYEKNRLKGREEVDERGKEMPVYACDKEGAERGGDGRRRTYRNRLCVCLPVCLHVWVCACICETCMLVFMAMFFLCWNIVHYCWKTHSCLGL